MSADVSSFTHHQPGVTEQISTRLAFLITGLAMSAWAPLVPFAQERLGVNEATLGALLLCLGGGSLVAMPLTGPLVNRFGCRRFLALSLLLMCTSLVFLGVASTIPGLALTLLMFGMALGATDVAMNMQAVMVEQASGRSMMSGFHGFYSLGGIFGAVIISGLLWLNLTPFQSLLILTGALLVLLFYTVPRLLPYGNNPGGKREPFFVLPRGKVLLLGSLCFIVFLAEGSVLDWSAVFLTQVRGVDPVQAGLGFACFSVAMTVARLTGDRIVQRLGGKRILLWGSGCAALGFAIVVTVHSTIAAYLGFTLIGLGASNIVPVLFTAAGNQKSMPMGLAISAVVSMGYAGLLAGPALIGFVAEFSTLSISLLMVAAGLLMLAACANKVTRAE
jgi:predicted MFS family arabinose efflux permease